MTAGQAVVYGVVQGLTEFLPISSTAHIRIVPALLGWPDPGAAFTAVIQVGTLTAVLTYFWRDISSIGRATFRAVGQGSPLATFDARLGWMIGIGTVPIGVVGFFSQQAIATSLRSLYVISASLILLALLLWWAESVVQRRLNAGVLPRELPDLGWLDAIVVGLAQAVALIPGSSRSGVTITGGLFLGMSRETAARFSFLMSLPSILVAGLYELVKRRHDLLASQNDVLTLLLATVVSGAVGYTSIALLLRYLKTHTTFLFIVYRLILGSLLLRWLAVGTLQP